MAKKTNVNVGAVITYILLLLLVAGIIGFFAVFTNGFTDDFKTFYIEHDGKKILKTDNTILFKPDEELHFDVKYTFGFLQKEEIKGYTVKIVPNVTEETDFDFIIDGFNYSFSEQSDLTQAFDIQLYDEYFTMTLSDETNVKTVLEKLYSGKDIEVPETVLKSGFPYFKMLISSYNGKSTYSITMNLFIKVQEIILEPSEVIF